MTENLLGDEFDVEKFGTVGWVAAGFAIANIASVSCVGEERFGLEANQGSVGR